ncbi:MAG: CotH kinase family protein, partial [Verrucomicrobiae bacterium]|nr:CotH kinase family protein [Verrucomicrobiae bacterium]
HLLARQSAIEDATWFSRYGGDLYRWAGTLVYDGEVYDHIHYRARGGVWRYAMTKNMWKFDFNRGHDFQARDNWGRKFDTQWTKLNLGASIQQGDYDHRGEQGMFESLGFRFFDLVGVPAVRTTFVQFRVVDTADETVPGDQYEGDFWGVYLSTEQPNGRFLDEHGLPDGNFYKMEGGSGELNNLGPAGPTNKSDLNTFLNDYNGPTETWWSANLNVPAYLSYQAIVQGIHHYDICFNKNYFYYFNPLDGRVTVTPWDLDLTWAENMYSSGCGGVDNIKSRLLDRPSTYPNIAIAYRNRVREVRDLLWNEDEAWRLIDEYADRLQGPATGPTLLDADRAQWDYNPKMTDSRYSSSLNKAGQGRFYQWPREPWASKDFAGCVQLMKDYVSFRASNPSAQAAPLDTIANDPAIPSTPTLSYAGAAGFPVNRLELQVTPYAGTNPFGVIQWRVGEITPPDQPGWASSKPWKYEIQAVWESGPITTSDSTITVPAGTLEVGHVYRARVQYVDQTGRASHWSAPLEFIAGAPDNTAALLDHLTVTELMYHAPDSSAFDFIELRNRNLDTALDLGGVAFTDGIDFTFPTGSTLPRGQCALVVKAAGATEIAAFRAHYNLPEELLLFGPYDGNFSDGGETVTLRTAPDGDVIFSFAYNDGRGWPVAADGAGHSLVPRVGTDEAAPEGALDYGGNWRASDFIGGSPGWLYGEPQPLLLLNEIAAHTDYLSELDSNDWIELLNP